MMRPPYSSAWERLTESALRYADADAEDEGDVEWLRCRDVLRKAALDYAASLWGGRVVPVRRRTYVSVEQLWLPVRYPAADGSGTAATQQRARQGP